MIVAINHRDASNMLHNDANDLIRSSGGSLNLGIKRGNNFTSAQYQAPTINKPVQNYKLDPFQFSAAPAPNQHNAFLKQQPNLPPQFMSAVANGPTYGPSYESNVENYVRSTPMSIIRVRDPKPVLSQTGSSCVPLGLTQIGNRSSVKRYRPASTMPILQRTNYNEPGVFTSNYKDTNHLPFYDKKMVATIQQTLSKAVHSPVGNPIVTPTQYPLNEYYYQQQEQSPLSINNQAVSPAPPVSYRSPTSMGNVPSLQTSNKVYSHHEVSQVPTQHAPFRKPDGPKVSHQQYNSPVGLYSREVFQEEFYKQVGKNNEQVETIST